LEEAAAIGGDGGDEEGADFLRGEDHEGEVSARAWFGERLRRFRGARGWVVCVERRTGRSSVALE
jgi:hypothetical protein